MACGEVVRAGRTLIVTRAEVFAVQNGQWNLCTTMQQTIMGLPGKTERAD